MQRASERGLVVATVRPVPRRPAKALALAPRLRADALTVAVASEAAATETAIATVEGGAATVAALAAATAALDEVNDRLILVEDVVFP